MGLVEVTPKLCHESQEFQFRNGERKGRRVFWAVKAVHWLCHFLHRGETNRWSCGVETEVEHNYESDPGIGFNTILH